MNQTPENCLSTFEQKVQSLTITCCKYPPPEVEFELRPLLNRLDASEPALRLPGIDCGKLADAFELRLETLRKSASMQSVPIVAICGTVNSGKSTITSSFLSEDGISRVLVGQREAYGTNRFVFWLPATWRGKEQAAQMEELIEQASGSKPEFLSDDPEQAAAQYNARADLQREFFIPLLAFDPKLDQGGIAFLDCPDIQRALDPKDLASFERRLAKLKAMAPLCSAFVVVASGQQAGTVDVGRLFEIVTATSAQTPIYFVYNMTESSDPETLIPEAEKILNRWKVMERIRRIYLAPHISRPEGTDSSWRPVVIPRDHTGAEFASVASELDSAELQRSHLETTKHRLAEFLKQLRDHLSALAAQKEGDAHHVREAIRRFLKSKLVAENSSLRGVSFDEAARLLAESIQRTSPVSIKLARKIASPLAWVAQKINKRTATKSDEERWSVIKESDFADSLMGKSCLPAETTEEELTAVWKNAYKSVQSMPTPAFQNASELDATTEKMWQGIPFLKRYAALLHVIIAMAGLVVAGCLAPLDGGATVVVWTKANMVLGGWELLGILIGGPIVGLLTANEGAKELVNELENKVALPQASNLFAGLCDGLGIPRKAVELRATEEIRFQLNEWDLNQQEVIIPTIGSQLIQVKPEWKELTKILEEEKQS